MRNSVRIEEDALVKLVGFAYETLSEEAVGGVYGEVVEGRKTRYVVDDVVQYQTAVIYPTRADIFVEPVRRLRSIIGEGIGRYHSHAALNTNSSVVTLSPKDKKDLEERPEEIEVVIAFNKRKRRTPLRLNKTTLSGTIKGRRNVYGFEIGAFYLEKTVNGLYVVRRAGLDASLGRLRKQIE